MIANRCKLAEAILELMSVSFKDSRQELERCSSYYPASSTLTHGSIVLSIDLQQAFVKYGQIHQDRLVCL